MIDEKKKNQLFNTRNKRAVDLVKAKEVELERILVATARRITSSHSEQSS